MPGFKISSLEIRIIYTINSQGFCQLYDIDWQLVQVVAGRWWRGGSRASFPRNPRVQENPSEIHEEIRKDSLEASTFRLEASTESFLSFPRNPTLQELPFLGLTSRESLWILMNPYESLWILMNPYARDCHSNRLKSEDTENSYYVYSSFLQTLSTWPVVHNICCGNTY